MLRIATLTYSFNALVLKNVGRFHHIENSGIVDLSFGSVRISGRCLLRFFLIWVRTGSQVKHLYSYYLSGFAQGVTVKHLYYFVSYPLHLRGRPPKGRDVKIFEVVVGH